MTAATAATAATSNNSILQNYLNKQASSVAADAANAANAATTSSSALAQATSASSIGSNFNTFINILTTQLQNQDPSNATDPNQFTQELVQFAGVEQQLNTNNDLQTLISLQKASSGTTAALGYMGGYVEAPANGALALQGGSAELGYTLTGPASNVSIAVKNSSGQTVTTLTGSTNTGLNYVTWNGQDSSGNQLANGAYTFTLTATNTDGSTQTVSDQRIIGQVTGVSTNSNGTTNLELGTGVSVPVSNVDAVFTSQTLPTATTPSS